MVFGSPHHLKKVGPPLKNLSGSAHAFVITLCLDFACCLSFLPDAHFFAVVEIYIVRDSDDYGKHIIFLQKTLSGKAKNVHVSE